MQVQDVMVREVEACRPDNSLDDIAQRMWNCNCGSIPVVDDNGAPVGMITDRDIAMSAALSHKPLWDLKASEVTDGRAIHCCQEDDDIKIALKTMWAQHVRRLPVVSSNGNLRGILSIDDIVTHAARGTRGQPPPDLSYDDAITMLKGVCVAHH